MGELLAIANNNSILAVMRNRDAVRLARCASEQEKQGLLSEITILVFAPRTTIIRWYEQSDIRSVGVAGSEEDLLAIQQKRNWGWADFYVPFSNGPVVAASELEHHEPTWEKFQYVFGPHTWSYKFGRRPNWLIARLPVLTATQNSDRS